MRLLSGLKPIRPALPNKRMAAIRRAEYTLPSGWWKARDQLKACCGRMELYSTVLGASVAEETLRQSGADL